ncbi:MAG: Dyp-type peroxidase [Jatrophihabitans sp.]
MTGRQRPGRRQFLSSAGLLVGGAALGTAGGVRLGQDGSHQPAPAAASSADPPIAFDGTHQAGVVERPPASLRFLALDLSAGAGTTAGLRAVLQRLSMTARLLMAGDWPAGTDGIATGLRPAGLTVTIGIGGSGLVKAGRPVPPPLQPLPAFAGDHLQPARSGGDLGVQICGEDALVVAAATRALLTAVRPDAAVRWSQAGFLRGAAATDAQATPRNLMGQLDGTDNPTGARQRLAVWVPAGVAPAWMANGSYLVCRRIRMLLDSWERLDLATQEAVIGRRKDTGAPLTGHAEHDDPDFAAEQDGRPVIAAGAHLRLTHPANNAGASMLRRGYAFDDGLDAAGQPDLGLFFQAFQTDLHRVFVPIQRKLAAGDALRRFIRHEASALFAIPAGASPGGFVGEALF